MARRIWRTATVGMVAAGLLAGCQGGRSGGSGAADNVLALGYPFGARHECDTRVANELQARGITPEAVDAIWYQEQERVDTRRDDRVVGYLAHVRLVDRPGLLVVETDAFCLIRQVYTRDGLELPGIPAF
jgi:hypothetical protein